MAANALRLTLALIATWGGLAWAGPPEPGAKPATEAEVRENLAKVERNNTYWGIHAIQALGRSLPPNDAVRADVARKLIDVAENGDGLMCGMAAEALGNWATDEVAPRMLTQVRANACGRAKLMEALGRIHYEKAIPTLVRFLDTGEDRQAASKALVAMGPLAEPAVMWVISGKDLSKRVWIAAGAG
jgi:hypothetical protein